MTRIPYRALLRTPGVARLIGAYLAAALSSTMTPVAFVLFAREATGSFATASLVLAASTTGSLIAAPLRGRLVDRFGARPALTAIVVPSIATDIALILAGRAQAPGAVLVACGAVAGAVAPPVASTVRTVWSQRFTEARESGYALMAAVTEVSFFVGPLLAGALVGLGSPTLAVAGTATLSALGALVFLTSADARAHTGKPREPGHGALAAAGVKTVLVLSVIFGLNFGTLDIAFVAHAAERGSAALAGVLLSALALGIGTGSLVYGKREHRGSAIERIPPACVLAAAGLVPLVLAPPLTPAIALAILAGLCFSPMSVIQITAIDDLAPAHAKTEAFAWFGTMYGVGSAAGATLAGQLIGDGSARPGFLVACLATALTYPIARTLRR